MRGDVFSKMVGAGLLLFGSRGTVTAQALDFSRDVRPILSQHCFKCHGPDDKQRMAGLRLDDKTAAYRVLGSGKRAIVPGKVSQSELVARIHASGPGLMPPAHTNKPLSPEKKKILERWIASGAVYKPHWAFVPPKSPALPPVKHQKWVRNPLDRFILARLEKEGLKPSPEADRYMLIRRVSLDLIGLPPTPEEAEAFAKDKRPDAYERLVDRLLASPHYGERWARRWLDLARYADTNGYEKDRQRSVWPYRDWVINALNTDMPFDRFTVEQIAGDMLPNATSEQRIATGFHRNTMLNEEGGIDPLEFRFYSMVDRNATTGTTWLGLTVGCAQCHTHKFDPLTHQDYYRLMAFMDNADEPTVPVLKPDITQQRKEIEKKIAFLEVDLPNRFPLKREVRWTPIRLTGAVSESKASLETAADGIVKVSGANPDSDVYTVTAEAGGAKVTVVRVEALTDATLGNGGPGRTPHGNFVLTEFAATVNGTPVKFAGAETDFAQDGFSAAATLDGNPKTGWAIHGPGHWNINRTITYRLEKPVESGAAAKWTFRLEQAYGGQHTLGKFRISVGTETNPDTRPEEIQRKERFAAAFADWKQQATEKAVRWTILRPTKAVSNSPLLTIQNDASVFSSGDITKRDVYDLDFQAALQNVTAIRLEALPDERLPQNGPGRVYYEGPPGDFFLSEITALANGAAVKLTRAVASYGNPAPTLDGNPQTGWSINGGQGQPQTAIFTLEKPLTTNAFALRLLFEMYYPTGLGRFRIAVTTDTRPLEATLAPDVEAILLLPEAQRTDAQNKRVRAYFLSVTPELQTARDEIKRLLDSRPAYPTALVFAERPTTNPRLTYLRHRGEYLQPKERVTAGVPAFLPPLPKNASANRLTFARWLVDERNPLTARVTVNRQWAALFGSGIVTTTEDFGFQGQPPAHPELLDWLACYFMAPLPASESRYANEGRWSLKKLHRLIVTSATYRQASRVTPELRTRDPLNRLLARGARVRLDAELVRDSVLSASGLLSPKMGGPSVFPPQPPGVTSEGTYGPLQWTVSPGADRYRRGLYTFSKRTAPYAMFTTFDAPSGEACLARREVSNTPLQALTLLNDLVFIDAAQALGRMMAARKGSVEERVAYLFQRCATRPPTNEERTLLTQFYTTQRQRFAGKELDAIAVAGAGEGDAVERAAWATLARSVLNLDETITKR